MPDADSVEQADIELGQTVAAQKEHPWVRAFVKVGDLGDQGPLYGAAAAVIATALAARSGKYERLGVSMMLAVAVSHAGKSLTKRLVKRTRPHVLLDQGRYQSAPGGSEAK